MTITELWSNANWKFPLFQKQILFSEHKSLNKQEAQHMVQDHQIGK